MPASAGGQMLLGIRLTLDSRGMVTGATLAEKSLQGVENKARKTQASVNGMANDMASSMQAAMAVGVAGMAAYAAGGKLTEGFEQAISETRTYETELKGLGFVADASAETLKMLDDTAKEIGWSTQFSPQEAISGMRGMLATGVEIPDMLKSIGAALDFVTGSRGMVTLENGMDQVAGAMKKFQETGESAAKIMDTFMHATRKSNLRPEDFGIFMRALRDAPIKLKMSSAEAFALGGALRNVTLTAAQSGQAINAFGRKIIMNQSKINRWLERKQITLDQALGMSDEQLRKLKAPAKLKAFKNFGVKIFNEAGKMRKPFDIMVDLGKRAQDMTVEDQEKFLTSSQTLFAAHASGLINFVTKMQVEGKKGVDAFIMHHNRLLNESKGANREAAASVESSLAGQEKFVEGTKQTIAIAMGETVIGLKKFGVAMDRWVTTEILRFAKSSPNATRAIMIFTGALGVLLKVVGVVMIVFGALAGMIALIGPALPLIGAAFVGIGGAVVAVLPFLLAGMAIALKIGVILFAVFKAWDYMWSGKATGMFKALKDVFKDIQLVFKAFQDWQDGAVDDLELFGQIQERGLTGWVFTLLQMRDRLVSAWRGIVQGFKEGMSPILWVLDLLSMAIGRVIYFLRWLFQIREATDITENLKQWESFGRLLGWIVAGALSLFIAKKVLLLMKMALVAIKLAAQIVLWTILNAKMLLIVAVIALLIWGYTKLLSLAMEFGEELGPSLYEGLTELFTMLDVFWESITGWFGDLGSAIVEVFTGNLKPIIEWFTQAYEMVKTLFGFITGNSSAEDLNNALPTSFKTAMDPEHVQGIRERNDTRGYEGEQYDPAAHRAALAKMNEKLVAERQASGGGSGRSVNIEKLEVTAGKLTPQEAAKLAKQVAAKIHDAEDEVAEESYQ